jgi:hypothetical protein
MGFHETLKREIAGLNPAWRLVLGCYLVASAIGIASSRYHGDLVIVGTLVVFWIWTLPVAGLILLSDKLLTFLSASRASVGGGVVFRTVVGFFWGVLWTAFVLSLEGDPGWFGFQVLWPWIGGAVAGLLLARPHHGWSRWIVVSGWLVALSFVGMLGHYPMELLVKDQRLKVIFIEWTPGPEPLQLVGGLKDHLSDFEIGVLRETGVGGKVRLKAIELIGDGEPALAIVILQRQVEEEVFLPQPKESTVVYVQRDDGWVAYPQNPPVVGRTIRLYASPSHSHHTWYSIQLTYGGSTGATAAVWPKAESIPSNGQGK